MAANIKAAKKTAAVTPNSPVKIHTYGGSAALYAGASPSGSDASVILFVPGLGESAQFFYKGNSMYADAFKSGCRTAFASFDIPGGKAQDMWANGEILARQISDACAYFNTPRLTIVSHSKGGVDAQTAAVHFGAANLVDRIITLSSPNWGSQLADLAYSSKGFALAELIGAHSPGCFSMQTCYMNRYRLMTDNSANNTIPILTFAGNGSDAEFTRIWAGSLYLDRFGENDGVVTVASAHNPKGEHMGTLHLNHSQMGSGRFVWQYIDSVLSGIAPENAVAASAVPYCTPPAQIIKGGRLNRGINDSFYVDSTIERLSICITLAGFPLPRNIRLSSPDGRRVPLFAKSPVNGSLCMHAAVEHPQVGKWKLRAEPGTGAYCAFISLSGGNVCRTCPEGLPPEKMGADFRILRTYTDGYDVVGEYSIKNGMFLPEPPKLENGVFNVEMNLTGELEDGSTFERTIISPLANGDDMREWLFHTERNKRSHSEKHRRRR
jgi:hypothetical protein